MRTKVTCHSYMVNQKAVPAYQYRQSSQFHHDSWDFWYLFLKNLAPCFSDDTTPLRFNFEKFLSHETSKKHIKNKLQAFRKKNPKTKQPQTTKKRAPNIYFLNLHILKWSPVFCTFEEGFKPQLKVLLKAVVQTPTHPTPLPGKRWTGSCQG